MGQGRDRKHRSPRAQRALTLLELLVGIVVVASGVMAILTTVTQGMRSLREHNQALLAKAAVKLQLEWLHTRTYAQVISGGFPDANGDGVGDGLEQLPGSTGTFTVCDYNPSANPPRCDGSVNTSMKEVTVTVNLATSRSFRASTLVSQ